MGSKFSPKSRFLSFKYAFKGIWRVFSEANFRLQFIIAMLTIALGFYFDLPLSEWLWIVGAIGFVLSAESFNTAIEHLVDLNHPDRSEKAGLVKDISAGAVLIASISAAIIGLLIFIPKIF